MHAADFLQTPFLRLDKMLGALLVLLATGGQGWLPRRGRSTMMSESSSSPYERSFTLQKPLGLLLEEGGNGGVCVEGLQAAGSAAAAGVDIAPGDRLVRIGGEEVVEEDFDAVMQTLQNAPETLTLTFDDGLGRHDITLARSLQPQDAVFADLVVRAAVREVRRRVFEDDELQASLGALLRVEILLGAGAQGDGRCLVRFFAIFSTGGGGSTYSCNVSATGRRKEGDDGGDIEIKALSCAKDEGWGRTIDLIREE